MSLKQEPLVSVVTPVYNGERYLHQCIESVLAQTYSQWDYVIVNNCSTDRTLEIAREYAARDPRIRIHSNEHFVRVIANHNVALRQISPVSKYCKVVAADDWLFPDCLEKMVQLAEENPSVAIVQSYRLRETEVAGDGLPYPSTVVPGRDACRMWLLPGRPSIFGAPSSLLYRSDIVRSRDSFYNESELHADTEVCLEFLENRDYGFVHQVLSFQRMRQDSMTSYTQRFQTDLPSRLYDLVTYGPRYLTESELQRAVREQLRQYYRSLGRQVFRRRGREFWRLHRLKLASVGYPLSNGRLAAYAVGQLLGLALNPASTAEKVAQRLRQRFDGPDSK
jgi:glycosyltransferase involved in cell wall biosynthesis